MRLLDHLAEHARQRPDALAVRAFGPCAQAPLSYGTLWERALAVSGAISAAVPSGGVVLLSCANRPEFFIAYLGVLAAGRTVFPVHPRLTGVELRAAAAAAGVSAVIGEAGAIEALGAGGVAALPISCLVELPSRAGIAEGPGVPGLLLQSSGTTGLPKIVYRDGPSLDAVAANVAGACRLTPADRVLGAVPLGHSYGMENALLGPIWAGACAHLCDGFDVPVVTSQLRGEMGATVLPGGAFMFEMLARLDGIGGERSSLRLAYSAGSALPPSAAGRFVERFGLGVGQLYGATEIGSVTFNDPGSRGLPPAGFDPSSVGVPMEGVDIAVVDAAGAAAPPGIEGHVLVRAPSMLSHYVGGEASPLIEHAGGRFFPTGDLGRVDAGGRLWITGRLRLLIDVGGIKVNPMEVERVLSQFPGVACCAVVPVAVSRTVSRVKAIVTPAPGVGPLDLPALRAFARERLAGHKMPRLFEVRDSLPLSPTGKVLRWRLASEEHPA